MVIRPNHTYGLDPRIYGSKDQQPFLCSPFHAVSFYSGIADVGQGDCTKKSPPLSSTTFNSSEARGWYCPLPHTQCSTLTCMHLSVHVGLTTVGIFFLETTSGWRVWKRTAIVSAFQLRFQDPIPCEWWTFSDTPACAVNALWNLHTYFISTSTWSVRKKIVGEGSISE